MEEAMGLVAELMAIAARTAPKAGGKDFIEVKVIKGEDVLHLADEMVEYGRQTNKKNFDRDGENVRASDRVVLLALKDAKTAGLNCGSCGQQKCSDLEQGSQEGSEFKGPWCAWRLIDLGIALGSAVKIASLLNIDNRIMYRIGVAARKMGLIEGDVVCGIPLSATGKNIYFDR